jgi:flagellin
MEEKPMATRINTNVSAMNAARYATVNAHNVSSSIEKLSSGLRINRAADDAAGLVISESMRAQVSGLDQAIKNSNDGINLIKTAEGALNEVHNLLRSMRTLAVHAANAAVNDTTATAADQAQLDSAVTSLDRIASSTKFNNKALLDGTFSGVFQIGANANETVSQAITSTSASTLGVNSLTLSSSAAAALTTIDAAISSVSSLRSSLGSFQKNVLESNVNSLSIAKENLAASESTIRDTDMAAEMVSFTKNNILSQASQAMLSQANNSSQGILQLLRG